MHAGVGGVYARGRTMGLMESGWDEDGLRKFEARGEIFGARVRVIGVIFLGTGERGHDSRVDRTE